MSGLTFRLFGKLRILDDDGQTVVIEARRAQELLCYLLLYRNNLYEREKLATLLWGDKCTAQAKRYLRQTLWQVQSPLHHQRASGAPLLRTDYERIGINQQATYWLDIAIFEQTFAEVESKPSKELTAHQVEMLRNTVQLYQGDLLEGWYADWCIYERERYQNMYLAMLDKLLGYSEAQHLFAEGLAYGTQILRYDRAREQTHRQLMRLHYQAGDRTAAIYQYKACIKALEEELGVGPARSTLALYQQICNEQVRVSTSGTIIDQTNVTVTDRVEVDPLQQLEQIQTVLTQLQTQVADLMQNINQTRNAQTAIEMRPTSVLVHHNQNFR